MEEIRRERGQFSGKRSKWHSQFFTNVVVVIRGFTNNHDQYRSNCT